MTLVPGPGRTAESAARLLRDGLLPLLRKHGARPLGAWRSPDGFQGGAFVLVQLRDHQEHDHVAASVAADPAWPPVRDALAAIGSLAEDWLEGGPIEGPPRLPVSVAGRIVDARGRTLLVRARWRPDTWELPGGQVETDESLPDALRREVLEESGVSVRLTGVTGVYVNRTRGGICVVFAGEACGGVPRPSAETSDAAFVSVTAATPPRTSHARTSCAGGSTP